MEFGIVSANHNGGVPQLSDLFVSASGGEDHKMRSCLLLALHPPLLGIVGQTMAQMPDLLRVDLWESTEECHRVLRAQMLR